MAGKPIDRKAKEEALKALIRQTIDQSIDLAPEDIPHRVRQLVAGQAIGDLDIEAIISAALKARRRR